MKIGKILLIAVLMAVNLISCERVGIFNVTGRPEKEEVVFVNNSGMPVNDNCAYTLQYALEEELPYRFVNQAWCYLLFLSFVVLAQTFPPYRWLLWGLIGLFLLSLRNRKKD